MTPSGVRRRCVCMAWLALAAPALAAQATVELKIVSRDVYVNEATEVRIEVSDFESCEAPEFPELPNCLVRSAGQPMESSFTSIVNGRMTQTHSRVYAYVLIPQVVGELTIPAVTMRVDGKRLTTRAVTLKVLPSDADQLFGVEISTGRARLYVGQQVVAKMTIWVRPPRYGGQLLDAGETLRCIRPYNFGPFPTQYTNASRGPRAGAAGTFYFYQFAANFIAERPGPLTFDDIDVGIEYPTRTGIRSLRARPVVEPVEILAVPTEGRPPGFAGAVGLFDIRTSASPTNVRVGDPIELTIAIVGEGPLGTLPPPVLEANAKLVEGFRLPTETLAGEVRDAQRVFKVTIRARRDDLTEIPPIEYAYFDPDAERFVVARSARIPISVAPAAEVAAPEVVTRTPQSGSEPAALQALDGLRDIQTDENRLLAQTTPVTTGLVSGLLLAPPAVFGLAYAGLAFWQLRLADPARRRRQAAARLARQRIARARTLPPQAMAGELAAALSGYLADRLDRPPAQLSGSAAVELLRARQADVALAERWATVLSRCEEIAFAGGSSAESAALCTEALACISAAERQKL